MRVYFKDHIVEMKCEACTCTLEYPICNLVIQNYCSIPRSFSVNVIPIVDRKVFGIRRSK